MGDERYQTKIPHLSLFLLLGSFDQAIIENEVFSQLKIYEAGLLVLFFRCQFGNRPRL
jgi:hypothetical protein